MVNELAQHNREISPNMSFKRDREKLCHLKK
jgi:hypothetical protein